MRSQVEHTHRKLLTTLDKLRHAPSASPRDSEGMRLAGGLLNDLKGTSWQVTSHL
jgi:hypothetical protein